MTRICPHRCGVRPIPTDSNGNYNLPAGTLVSTGDTVLVSQHNPFATDVAAALSSRLSRDGLGGMRADLDMGGYKLKNMASGAASSDAVTVAQLNAATNGVGVPIGIVFDFWGNEPPPGYLFAAGQAISRTTYAALFAVIGIVAGAGDGSTTFNLPDYRALVSAGRADMGGTLSTRLSNFASATLAAIFGNQQHQLGTNEMPVHSHVVTDPGHAHGTGWNSTGDGTGSTGGVSTTPGGLATQNAATGITVGNAGGTSAHNNVQPTIICNKIIYAGNA